MNTPKIVTIGGGNGHSNILGAIQKSFVQHIDLSAIVSMSDDGRTTGRLMRYFHEELGIHFPPPGDVRRCLYFLSGSALRSKFEKYFEIVLDMDVPISSKTLGEIAKIAWAYDFLESLNFPYFNITLPLSGSLDGHKFWNIFMGFLFHHFDDDYGKMVDFMHQFLKVKSRVIPVTTDSAYIQAKLDNGRIIERQDNISNNIDYSWRIVELSLMSWSEKARHSKKVAEAITSADYIIIAPGDLYTSTISNLIIGGVADLIKNYSHAKIIFIANNTNKWWEAKGYQMKDFVVEIEKYLWKNIDVLIVNNHHIELSESEKQRFKNDISVKGGDYIFITDDEKREFSQRGMYIIEADILDRKSLYKHDQEKIAIILEEVIFHKNLK